MEFCCNTDLTCLREDLFIVAHVHAIILAEIGADETCQVFYLEEPCKT